MADACKVWDTVMKKWFGTEHRRVTMAIGHAIVDKGAARGRTYILLGPPATGKSTVLKLIGDIFGSENDIVIAHDLDLTKLEEYREKYDLKDRILFGASNVEPPAGFEVKDCYIIHTQKKSRPMGQEEYKKVVNIMSRGIMDIRRHCAYTYVLADAAYAKMSEELRGKVKI